MTDNGRKQEGRVALWTTQAPVVLDTLERDGIYVVKTAFVEEKYRESAWIFRTAYREFSKLMARKVEKTAGAESPIWLFRDSRWPFRSEGAFLLQLEVPESEIVQFDQRDWSCVLNLSLVGTEEEKKAFAEELRRQGIGDSSDVFARPFYPIQKKRILDSWSRLLERPLPEETYIQAAAWILRKEWIKECRKL